MAKELSASMGTPMGGFFDKVDVVFATLASSATAHGVPTEVTTLPTKQVSIDEGTYTGKVSDHSCSCRDTYSLRGGHSSCYCSN